jgi:hypothetical protein
LGGEKRLLEHDGASFEIRGVVQIEGTAAADVHIDQKEARFPFSMRPAGMDLRGDRLHLLCGVLKSQPAGTEAARLVATDESGEKLELVLRHGMHVAHGSALSDPQGASIVWSREQANKQDTGVRSVSHVVWPLGRQRRIVKLEFHNAATACYPFLLAVSAP